MNEEQDLVLIIASIFNFFGRDENLKNVSADVRKQVKKLHKEGKNADAAELLFQAGAYEAAAVLFLEASMLSRAAESHELAGNAAQAIALYKRVGNKTRAGELYAEMGQYEAGAIEMIAAGLKDRAAEFFSNGGQHRRSAELFEECKKYRKAAKAYMDAGDKVRQMEMYILAFQYEFEMARGNLQAIEPTRLMAKQAALFFVEEGEEFDRAIKLLNKAGYVEDAAKACVKAGKLKTAAKLFEKANNYEMAARYYEQAGQKQHSARCLAQVAMISGELERAAAYFARAGEYEQAAELFNDLRQPRKAAEMYLRAKKFQKAASLFERAGDLLKAAKCYEAAKDLARAADLYAKVGNVTGELRTSNSMKDYFRVGRILAGAERAPEALDALKQVENTDPKFRDAGELQGDLLYKEGQHQAAFDTYQHGLGDAAPSVYNIALIYKMARCLEKLERFEEAARVHSQILKVDPNFRGVLTRIEKLKQLALQAQAGPGASPGVLRRRQRTGTRQNASAPQSSPVITSPVVIDDEAPLRPQGPSGRRYEVIEEIARGGMGVVYKARDTVLSRILAFKVLGEQLKNNKQAVKYFLREARAAASLTHSNIVTVYDAGEQDGEYYMAMEYIEGKTLKQLVTRQGPFPEKLVRYVLAHACRGLQYAHERGIVHRDIKGANIMLTSEEKLLKIMDFGLAKVVTEVQADHTRAIGTPFYMSPEQIIGDDLDNRSDIYSLGITIFELATGTVPYTKGDLAYHHIHSAPPTPRSINPTLSETLEKIILKTIEKKPDDRFASCRDILTLLKEGTDSGGFLAGM